MYRSIPKEGVDQGSAYSLGTIDAQQDIQNNQFNIEKMKFLDDLSPPSDNNKSVLKALEDDSDGQDKT